MEKQAQADVTIRLIFRRNPTAGGKIPSKINSAGTRYCRKDQGILRWQIAIHDPVAKTCGPLISFVYNVLTLWRARLDAQGRVPDNPIATPLTTGKQTGPANQRLDSRRSARLL